MAATRKFVQRDLIIRRARLSYPALWTPKPPPPGQPGEARYSAMLILEPANPGVAAMVAAAKAVATDKWGDKGEKILAGLRADKAVCFGKGEERTNRDGDVPEELAGMIWINTGRSLKKGPPLVVDLDPRTHITEASGRVYGGCYVNAKLEIWPLDMTAVQRRIVATLVSIQFVDDGDAFGGGKAPDASGFEDLSEESAADEGAGADFL